MEAKKVFKAAYRNARMSRREDPMVKRYEELLKTIEQEGGGRYPSDMVIHVIGGYVRPELTEWQGRFRENPKETLAALASILRKRIADRTTPTEVPEGWDKLVAFAESCTPEVKKRTRTGRAICPVTKKAFAWQLGRYVSAKGLGDMVWAGINAFEEKHGGCIPTNMVFSNMSERLMVGSSPIVRRGAGTKVTQTGADRLLREYGRIRGWLTAAAGLPALAKVIKKTQSKRGVNSPYTKLYLPELWSKYPSPGHLERKLWKVRRRAEAILSAYEGEYNPSWNHIAHAILKTRQVGKAAIIVVAETLSSGEDCDHFRNYAAARSFLTSIRTAAFPVADNSDGVEACREVEPVFSRLGISVYRIRVAEEHGRFSRQLLVRHEKSGRTYHTEWGHEEQEAVKTALRAWREQDRIAKQNADLAGFLQGEAGFCPMVVREDSYRAGNCGAGTESWARQHGFAARDWIPGHALVPHLGDEQVRRVAYACRESFVAEGLVK